MNDIVVIGGTMEKEAKEAEKELYVMTRQELEEVSKLKLALSELQYQVFEARYIRKESPTKTQMDLNISHGVYFRTVKEIRKVVLRLEMKGEL